MAFIGDIFAFLVRPLAVAAKVMLPQHLAKHFEPDSTLGDFVGFGILVVVLVLLVIIVRVYIYAAS